MRAIALAILFGLYGIETAVRGTAVADTVAVQILAAAFLVCLIFGK